MQQVIPVLNDISLNDNDYTNECQYTQHINHQHQQYFVIVFPDCSKHGQWVLIC